MPDPLKNEQLPGTKLFLVDDLPPEDLAMVQALYSRSAESVEAHLEKVARVGSGKFVNSYVVNYNHKSIADCGTTTFFIEGVSTLVAKAIQDWPLYSGQETSTRYIDMSQQRIVDPVGTPRSKEILDRWMDFYLTSQGPVSDTIRQRYPQKPGEKDKDKDYEGAIKARTFDSLRGFLPSGVTTQLSWHTNLRQAGDHITLLSKHPSEEVRQIGLTLQAMFNERYPSSGGVDKAAVSAVTGNEDAAKTREEARQERAAWDTRMSQKYNYSADVGFATKKVFSTTIDPASLLPYAEDLVARPRGCVLPHFFSDLGQCSFNFLLDFGSFRDLQRHRNGVCRMPLVTTKYGFEPWYLEQLGDKERATAQDLIASLSGAASTITDDPVVRQYYLPMGFRVPCQVTYALPSTLYVLELRSGKTIHPTLRRTIQGMIQDFKAVFPELPLHADMDLDDWTVRRGSQTITAK